MVEISLLDGLTEKKLMQVVWLGNPFGLNDWLIVNTKDGGKLYETLKAHAYGEGWDASVNERREVAREASRLYKEVSEVEVGYLVMRLDWSWAWPNQEPCLWSMADANPWLWDDMEIVEVTAKLPSEHTMFKPYRNAPNDTLVRVPQDAFANAMPVGTVHERLAHRMTLEDYKEWTERYIRIGLGFTDPNTILYVSN